MEAKAVDEFVEFIEASILRRKKDLEDDLQANVVIENRLVSDRLASVQGLQKHLSQARMAKLAYETQMITDHDSHATITRAHAHRKYSFT